MSIDGMGEGTCFDPCSIGIGRLVPKNFWRLGVKCNGVKFWRNEVPGAPGTGSEAISNR